MPDKHIKDKYLRPISKKTERIIVLASNIIIFVLSLKKSTSILPIEQRNASNREETQYW